jgi:hypothetical protein
MKQREYTEGTQALENFKSLASAILQAPVKKKKRADPRLLFVGIIIAEAVPSTAIFGGWAP